MGMRVRPGKFLMRNAMRGVYDYTTTTPKCVFLNSSFDLQARIGQAGWVGLTAAPYGTTTGPTTPNGHTYLATVDGGVSAGSEPTFPTDGTTVTDGTQVWQDLGDFPPYDWAEVEDVEMAVGPAWTTVTAVSLGDIVQPTSPASPWMWVCTTAGNTGVLEPTWDYTEGNVTLDNDAGGTAAWTALGYNPGALAMAAQGDYPLLGADVTISSVDCATSGDWFIKVDNITMGTNLTEADVKYAVIYQPGSVVDYVGDPRIGAVYAVIDLDDGEASIALASDSPVLIFAPAIDACAGTPAFQIQFFSGF